MPVTRVIGFEAEDKICLELIGELKKRIASIDELHVTEKQVSPFIEREAVQAVKGEEVVVYIDGLFEKAERTPEVCKQLTDKIYWTVLFIVKKYKMTNVKFIEVINYTINPEKVGYSSGNPFEWTEDEVVDAFNVFQNSSNISADDAEKKLRTFLKTLENNSFGKKGIAAAVQYCVPSHCANRMFDAIISELEG